MRALTAQEMTPQQLRRQIDGIANGAWAPGPLNVAGYTVQRSGILSYDRIVFRRGSSLMLDAPTAQFYAVAARSIEVESIAPRPANASGPKYRIGLEAPASGSLDGRRAADGADGESFDVGNTRQPGGRTGGSGDWGGEGGDGRPSPRSTEFIFYAGEFRSEGRVLTPDEVRQLDFVIDVSGARGGNGGRGGDGGDGGNGEGGASDNSFGGSPDADAQCISEGSEAGDGGRGGAGGLGGNAGDGSAGARLYLMAPGDLAPAVASWRLVSNGGEPGARGPGGVSGRSGAPGHNHSSYPCAEYSPAESPAPFDPQGYGYPGRRGADGSAAFGRVTI